MKKHLTTSALLICIAFLSNAQNLISKIPQSASIVVKYAGENFTKNISLQKIDSYHFIKNDFFKMLHIDTLTSIQNLGVNFEQDAYQYITNEDTSLNFVTLFPLKNKEQFLRTLKSKYNSAGRFEKKNGYDFYTVSPETYVGFTETTAVIVNSTYQNRRSYYDYLYPSYNTVSDSVKVIEVDPVEETVPVMDMPAADTVKFTPPKIVKDKIKKGQQPVKKKPTATKPTAKGKTKPKPKTQRAPMEEVMEDAVISTRKYGNLTMIVLKIEKENYGKSNRI
ncbi:MAG: hypothetical protein IPP48_01340 [Chitinophagaceae bacterium]|nr:hypothetical protein [Chitinophagaceae bacterium]